MRRTLCMGNLRFPLLEAYRSTSRANLARQRLSLGEVVFSTNKCNFIKLTDKEYLGYPRFMLDTNRFDTSIISLDSFFEKYTYVTHEKDCVYTIGNRGMRCIIVDYTILGIFSLDLFTSSKISSCMEYEDCFVIRFVKYPKLNLVFSKLDFSFQLRSE